jgi:predicted NBD/HSP70 family sugar kinase
MFGRMRRRQGPTGTLRSLRERNREQVVEVLRRQGRASRAEIARITGLSRSTVSSLVNELQEEGLVSERGDEAAPSGAQGGRPAALLSLEAVAGSAVGLDFGHTHVHVAVADLSSRIIAERRISVDVDRAAGDALDTAAELVERLLAEAQADRERVVAVGVGLPGPIDRGTGTFGASLILPGWVGLRPVEELERRLRLPVEVDNDANLGALGELTYGAGRGESDIIYLTIAAGIGAGLIHGGRVHRGATGIAGELGHVAVDPAGRVCGCGNRGCLETMAAAPALLELLARSHGADLTLARLLELADAGDPGVCRALGDAGRAIGRVVADVVNVVNPRTVIVGGELAAAGEPLLRGIRDALERHTLPAAGAAVGLTAGELGERAELLGALALVIAHGEPDQERAPLARSAA